MADWHFQSARVLADRLRRRELSSLELTDAFLERIARLNPAINAVTTLDPEGARAAAKRADEALARGDKLGPLHGIPMTVKDVYEVTGMRTTAGAKPWADYIAKSDAVSVQRLRDAGAIIMGKTNVPAFASDFQSWNPIFGVTNNPWDVSRTPGGSSGGSAAALAAGLTPLELGSDIAGSIRIPSSFCGVLGHKPTYELVPMRGHIPGPPGSLAAVDLAVCGPMARSADDLAYLLAILAGPLPEQAKAYRLQLPPPRAASLRGYRVGVWLEDPAYPLDPEVASLLRAAVDELRRAGANVREAKPDFGLADAHALYGKLFEPIIVAGAPPKVVAMFEAMAASSETGPLFTSARNAIARHGDWLVANELRAHLKAKLARFFEDYDVLLCPTVVTPAFVHDHSNPQSLRKLTVAGAERPYFDLMGWISFATATHHPATVAPVGRTKAGLPVGIQIIAPYLEDLTSIDFAGRLGEVVGGFEPPPGY